MCSKPKIPKQPKPVWDVSQARAPEFKMSSWLKQRLLSGNPTDLNTSVTIMPPPPPPPASSPT